jgi:hypothetical protein
MDVTNIIKPSGPLYPRHLINGVLKKHVTIAVFLFPVPLLAQNLSLHATLTTHFIAFLIRVHLYSRSSGHVGRHLRQVAVPNFDSFFHPKTTFNAFFFLRTQALNTSDMFVRTCVNLATIWFLFHFGSVKCI